ncbi:MAG: hypothetical protein HY676_04850 [Chloroflexi bacterium]|nr:hypothetical protein [Chloroflexota bacterium]
MPKYRVEFLAFVDAGSEEEAIDAAVEKITEDRHGHARVKELIEDADSLGEF